MGQPWVPLPELAAIETAPALGSRRLSLGSQRREVCSEGHSRDRGEAQVPLQFFHIRLSLKREELCSAQGQLRNHAWKQSRRLQSVNLGRSLGPPGTFKKTSTWIPPQLIDLGVVVQNVNFSHLPSES